MVWSMEEGSTTERLSHSPIQLHLKHAPPDAHPEGYDYMITLPISLLPEDLIYGVPPPVLCNRLLPGAWWTLHCSHREAHQVEDHCIWFLPFWPKFLVPRYRLCAATHPLVTRTLYLPSRPLLSPHPPEIVPASQLSRPRYCPYQLSMSGPSRRQQKSSNLASHHRWLPHGR